MSFTDGVEDENLRKEYEKDLCKCSKELEYWKDTNEQKDTILQLYNTKNKKVIGKFKDELNGKVMSEIAFLRSKQYGFLENEQQHLKCKGITRAVTKNLIKFSEMKNCLNPNAEDIYKTQITLNNKKHDMYKMKTPKKALTRFDDKRYICDDGITTYPFPLRGDPL